ncbi:hypothetical protein [Nitrospirillum pindoramense]|uniref:hypothetical protein n=1 Tax=Nitrospirillum amazonense TaxID=28077 RepID=UPI0011A014A7|nr:hypothetical protein [Nitrospirillum amazonense]
MGAESGMGSKGLADERSRPAVLRQSGAGENAEDQGAGVRKSDHRRRPRKYEIIDATHTLKIRGDAMNRKEIETIAHLSIREILSDFRRSSEILNSDSINKEKSYLLYEYRKGWERTRTCLTPGCSNHTIKSHTVQKNGPLKSVSYNNYVISPELTFNGPEIRRVSLEKASTFQGFCRHHDEVLFSGFEKRSNISSGHDIAMQSYRTICREITRIKYNIQRDNYNIPRLKRAMIAKISEMSFEIAKSSNPDIQNYRDDFQKIVMSNSDYLLYRLSHHLSDRTNKKNISYGEPNKNL